MIATIYLFTLSLWTVLSLRQWAIPYKENAFARAMKASSNADVDPVDRIEVYGISGCKYCRIAKATLVNYGLPFTDVDIDKVTVDEDVSELTLARYSLARSTTVPQIYFGLIHIGGCSDLLDSIASKGIEKMLTESGLSGLPRCSTKMETNRNESCPSNDATIYEQTSSFDIMPSAGESLNSIRFMSLGSSQLSRTLLLPELAAELQDRLLKLSDVFISQDGKVVNYHLMKSSADFRDFIHLASRLNEFNESSFLTLSISQRKTFFINLYNAMVIHANVLFPAPADTLARSLFFSGASGVFYTLSKISLPFSLDDIEHGILRCNRPRVSSDSTPSGYFGSHEYEKLAFGLPSDAFDPRIHFILNCGAKSCPPIRVLNENNLNEALDLATKAFLDSEVNVELSSSYSGIFSATIRLTRLLFWYATDFGPTILDQLRWVRKALPDTSNSILSLAQVLSVLESRDCSQMSTLQPDSPTLPIIRMLKWEDFHLRIEYMPYDWGRNDLELDS